MPAGRLGHRLGPFQLHPKGQPIPLIQIGRDSAAMKSRENYLEIRPKMSDIHSLISHQASAVITHRSLIPEEARKPFQLAGKKFEDDFNRYCSTIVFLPFLAARDGWTAGFEIYMAGCASGEIESFFSNTPTNLKANLTTTIFLNSLTPLGQPIPVELLQWLLVPLIGRVKAGQLAIARGLRVGERVRETCSYLYQKALVRELTDRGNSLMHDNSVGGLDRLITSSFLVMSEEEKQQMWQLEV